MLSLDRVSAGYGDVRAISDITLRVDPGETVALLGANGAGKSTILRAISGLARVYSGSIRFEGTDLAAVAPSRRAFLGIAHVPEGRRVFRELTVTENLDLGATALRARFSKAEQQDLVFSLFPRLRERRSQLAGTLSGGEQQMLAIGRALMMKPRLVLLDEPSLGLAPLVLKQIFQAVEKLREVGLTVVLSEQRIGEALNCCNRGIVIAQGKTIFSGSSAELLKDETINRAYFGSGQPAASGHS